MRLLLDEQLPRRLRDVVPASEVRTVREMGWAGTKNAELLRRAQKHFDVFVTMDKSIPFQQVVVGLAIGVLVLRAWSNRFRDLAPFAAEIGAAASRVTPGSLSELDLRELPRPGGGFPSA